MIRLEAKQELEERTGKNRLMRDILKAVGNRTCLKLETEGASSDIQHQFVYRNRLQVGANYSSWARRTQTWLQMLWM